MSEEIFLDGKTYVSSKRAASDTGYAQDYIGQLARKSLIDAQRVGGLWYVQLDSLAQYQRNAASYSPLAPVNTQKDIDAVITFDGKDFISAGKAAKTTGYNQDYIGQLARSGKVLSRQIGNRWYVDREMLLRHKAQKDSLLAAVQAESLGILTKTNAFNASETAERHQEPLLTYIREDDRDLMPRLAEIPDHDEAPTHRESAPAPASHVLPMPRISTPATAVQSPIRLMVTGQSALPMHDIRISNGQPTVVRRPGKTKNRAIKIGTALTFIIVLSYGITTLQSHSVYTTTARPGEAVPSIIYSASAIGAADTLIATVESWIVPQLSYHR